MGASPLAAYTHPARSGVASSRRGRSGPGNPSGPARALRRRRVPLSLESPRTRNYRGAPQPCSAHPRRSEFSLFPWPLPWALPGTWHHSTLRGPSCCCLRSPQSRIQRQRDREFAPFLGGAFDEDLPAVRPRNVPHERQPQSCTLDVVHQRISTAVKLLKDFLLLVRWDADSSVPDFQIYAAVRLVQAHTDIFLVLGVLQCVIHQVKQPSGDRFAVYGHRRNIARDVLLESKTILFDL